MTTAKSRTTVSGEGCKRLTRVRVKRSNGKAGADEFGCSTLLGGMAVIEGRQEGGLEV
jgi:hypothetical protein